MTFDTREISNYDSEPFHLYEFTLGTTTWRYTARDTDAVYGGNTYTSCQISDSGVSDSGQKENDEFTITLASLTDFSQLFVGTPPSESIFVRVRRMHHGDTEAPIIWAGTYKSSKRKTVLAFELTCRTLTSSLNRLGLRLTYSRGCPHSLYDRNCRVDAEAFAIDGAVTAINGLTVEISMETPKPDHWFDGGFMTLPGPAGSIIRKPIEQQVGSQVTILTSTEGLSVGTLVALYPGCDRVTLTCVEKFNNLSNYGGFPHLPIKSPFDFDPVF